MLFTDALRPVTYDLLAVTLPVKIWTRPTTMIRPSASSFATVNTSWILVASRTLQQFTQVRRTEETGQRSRETPECPCCPGGHTDEHMILISPQPSIHLSLHPSLRPSTGTLSSPAGCRSDRNVGNGCDCFTSSVIVNRFARPLPVASLSLTKTTCQRHKHTASAAPANKTLPSPLCPAPPHRAHV